MENNTTIVISCAGMGTRLGLGSTKALVDICGKPLIIRQLEMLDDFEDIRIVVGYQAEKVINIVRNYRNDIIFAFNYAYRTTGTAASFSKGIVGAKKFSVTLDGDLLVNPKDLKKILYNEDEVIGVCLPSTENPVLVDVKDNKVIKFSRERGQYEWTGIAKLRTNRIIPESKHVYMIIEHNLPMPYKIINTKEIDTQNDYEKAIEWVKNGYK